MKKLMATVLCVSLLFFAVPIAVHADTDDEEVVSTHGSKTYLGTYSDWQDTWDEDNFTDVTGEDVDVSNDLVIKNGKIGAVSVSGDSNLTIRGGTMGDVSCDGDIQMNAGKANSLQCSGDISISGGSVSEDVNADGGVYLAGPMTLGGDVEGNDVQLDATNSSGTVAVAGDVSFSGDMTLSGSHYHMNKIDGQSSGTLQLQSCTGTLPAIDDMTAVTADEGSVVTTSQNLQFDSLSLSDGARFSTTGTLTVGTLSGPGTLIFNAGKLTVQDNLSDLPVFDLNGTASTGTTVFRASSGSVSVGDAIVYGYGLSLSSSGDYNYFSLQASSGDGVSVSPASVSVASGSPVTVKVSVSPALSNYTSGTQLCWKLTDPSSAFSISPSTTGDGTCTVRLTQPSGSSVYRATLAAYLADSNGNLLSSYKTAACAVTSSSASSTTVSSGLTLDTKTVTISLGHKYCVLAITGDSTPPKQLSYNSAVATVGKASAYNYNGKVGWLYPITAVSGGGVTVNIGGQTVLVTIS
jgi:hypothetical protein